MDEKDVREHARSHGNAVVEGDLRKAGGDLAPEAQSAAPGVMKQLPRPVTSSEVAEVRVEGDEAVALIRYGGEDASVTVESRWAERDGRPKIVSLEVV